ncbi:MAG: hypothetical protein K9I26_07655 [Flavobacterium sp.]|nr:hypothetical protein [Flavobacterium sp.]
MTTITLKIDERSKKGKAFLEFAKTFFTDEKEVELVESKSRKLKKGEEDLYNPEFVKMILDRDADIKSGKTKCITLDPNDIWGSLGLK